MSSILEIFKKYGNKIDALDLELIISAVIKKPREFIIAHPKQKLTKSQIVNLQSKIKRRMRHEPLAYILSEKEFYGLNFKVNKNVLIPRPETELMVEEALNKIKQESKKTTKQKNIFIDVGTGSGCIIITLVKNSRDLRFKNYDLRFFGVDISKKTLKIAKYNAEKHKVDKQIKFLNGDLLKPILKSKILNHKSKIIILANLPYLTPSQIKKFPSIKYEPKLALDAGQDGLKYYRQLFSQIKTFTKFAYHSQIFAICEIDSPQTSKIKNIIKTQFPQAEIQIKKDLCGLDRLVVVEINY